MQVKALLALILLVGRLGAVCGPTDVNAWDMNGSLVSRCAGGEDLTQNGTVAYASTACSPWTQGINAVTDTNFAEVGTTTLAAMQGLGNWTAGGWFYTPSTFANDPAILEFFQSVAVNYWFQILNTGAMRVGRNNAIVIDTSAGFFSTSTCYYIAVVGTGTTLKTSVSLATAIDSNFDTNSTVASAALPGAMTAINFGRLDLAAGKFCNTCLLYGWRLRNVAESSFPMTDPSGDLSPYQWNSNSPNMFPNQLPLLLKLFLFPKNLQALEADSRPVATSVALQAARSREEYVDRLVREGRISPTRTPTIGPSPTPVRGTRTPTSTPTPDPGRTR